ncbi:hypothetical protein [Streptomyces flavofungini]|uniref:Uncharacterized protein n=1 Tax=Streptomyces flavofungini TaxID=68200 RepID=A0ABS0XA17_9ACTN|nr:hypothetical protein [Streptomyces flavofungini]MBJ3810037.1 hypothetical protein [Streptomyces flavofungini]GHC53256.1 hypothetical protein GCM10010349_19210 [Streptomyces flavofungini]
MPDEKIVLGKLVHDKHGAMFLVHADGTCREVTDVPAQARQQADDTGPSTGTTFRGHASHGARRLVSMATVVALAVITGGDFPL